MNRSLLRLSTSTIALLLAVFVPVAAASAQVEDDADAVYRAALDELYKSNEAPGVILLSDSMLRFTGDRSWVSPPVPIDYRAQPMKAPFPADFSYRIPLHLLSRREGDSLDLAGRPAFDSMIAARQRPVLPFWIALERRYPTAWGVTTFSEVIFNDVRNKALLRVMHNCGGCFHDETMRLIRIEKGWQVDERLIRDGGSQDGIGPGNMRHLWVDARLRADSLVAHHIESTREADSIRLDRTPRRWRGVVINSATRRPTSAVSVFKHVPLDTIPRHVEFVRTGEFELNDHRIGGGFLLVQCAGFPMNHTEPLAVVNFLIEPAQDTTVMIELGSLQPCWTRSRIRPLQTGRLQTTEFRSAEFPSRAEAGVIAALYRDVFAGPNKPLLRAFTGIECYWLAECPRADLATHVSEGALDSSTIRDILQWRGNKVPINSQFAQDIGVVLLTPENEKFLEAEAAVRMSRSRSPQPQFGLMEALAEAYSSGAGLVSINKPGFNRDSSQALLEMRQESGPSSSRTELLLFTRQGTEWRVVRRRLGEGNRVP